MPLHLESDYNPRPEPESGWGLTIHHREHKRSRFRFVESLPIVIDGFDIAIANSQNAVHHARDSLDIPLRH